MNEILLLLTLLMFKHTVADFYIQRSFMFADKHIYGAPGGLTHAGMHGIGTAIVLFSFFSPAAVLLVACLDSIVHYHVDYAKSKIQLAKNYTINDTKYWILFGTDQFLHFVTYVVILVMLYNAA